jgi:3-hydroxyisobutyrate dehydrogenase-like beta-hydroxyacid dehydrogenase
MKPQRIGILHPGEMGISIAASAKNSGNEVYWASEGRGPATRDRAAKFELRDARTLTELCAQCSIILSVCPPHAAESVADQVVGTGFSGLYVEANAIAPQRTIKIGERMSAAGVSFVDGGIIGLPAWKPGATCLYLSGPRAAEIAGRFAAGPLDAKVLGAAIGKASALKMCYAAYTKGTTALLAAILATADRLDVRASLFEQWKREDAAFVDQSVKRVSDATLKAWRWTAEMDEISRTFREAGLPGEFHAAAGIVYRRLAQFKDASSKPTLEEFIAALLQE